jgi:hypothetical protein
MPETAAPFARGQKAAYTCAALLIAIDATSTVSFVLRFGTDRLPVQLVRLGLTIALGVALARGSNLARSLLIILLGVAAVLGSGSAAAGWRAGNTGPALYLSVLALGYILIFRVLVWSKDLRIYLDSP